MVPSPLPFLRAQDMTNENTIPIGWLLAAVLTVTLIFNGIALALA